MMILLSVKKIYCDLILQGTKQYEFRKRLPNRLQKGDQIALYCTQPTSKVVAYVDVTDVIQSTPHKLWKRTSFSSGIDYTHFSKYFANSQCANAIQIGTIHELKQPLSLTSIRGNRKPPQSFLYLTEEEALRVRIHASIVNKNFSVFVGGVHGVGKTTFLNGTLKQLGFASFSASDLIKRQELPTRNDKTVDDVAKNQVGLAIESSKESEKHRLYAIDGHFTLLSNEKTVLKIPVEVFSALHLDCLILLSSSCEEIQARLNSRDGTTWSKSLIRAFVRKEELQAKTVSAKLGIPLLKLSIPNPLYWEKTKEFIKKVLKNKFSKNQRK